MPGKRINPNLVKTHRSYTASELAKRLRVHKNTIRNWVRAGFPVLDGKPALYHGGTVRAFLKASNDDRRRPCPPGMLYCFRCRDHRKPALGMVDFSASIKGAGNLTAICEECGATMNRRARPDSLALTMPGVDVKFLGVVPPSELTIEVTRQATQADRTLSGCREPSPNCAAKGL